MKYSPVLIFTYKRADHFIKLIDSLKKCKEYNETFFYIFSDGPKDSSEISEIENVRCLIDKIFANNYELIKSNNNKGLANSVIDGISYVFKHHDEIIVIEDDLIVSDNFLEFMNNALKIYQNNLNVYQISGFNYMSNFLPNSNETFFLPITTSWGWATWKRAWQKFNLESSNFKNILFNKKNRLQFDLNGNYPYSKMLEKQLEKNINSWAIIWYASVFINKGLVVYPPYSLVNNNGFDGSGTHGNKLVPSYNKQFKFVNNKIIYSTDVFINFQKFKSYQKSIKKYMPNKYHRIIKFIFNKFYNFFSIHTDSI